jgi:hypothetical protein
MFVEGATCDVPGECCRYCKQELSTTFCGTSGFCGSGGTCEESACIASDSSQYCGGRRSDIPCIEQCLTGSSDSCTTISASSLILPGKACETTDGAEGICVGTSSSTMSCASLTYTWHADDFPVCNDECRKESEPLERTVVCRASDGRVVAADFCDPSTKPPHLHVRFDHYHAISS